MNQSSLTPYSKISCFNVSTLKPSRLAPFLTANSKASGCSSANFLMPRRNTSGVPAFGDLFIEKQQFSSITIKGLVVRIFGPRISSAFCICTSLGGCLPVLSWTSGLVMRLFLIAGKPSFPLKRKAY